MREFHWPVRVYYEDTDAGGVVYHTGYLRFMERARTEWLRAGGVEQDGLLEEQGVLFAVRAAEVDFLHPARFNDLLEVRSTIAERRRASLVFDQRICRAGEDEILCRARIRVVSVDARAFRPCAIPGELLEVFET